MTCKKTLHVPSLLFKAAITGGNFEKTLQVPNLVSKAATTGGNFEKAQIKLNKQIDEKTPDADDMKAEITFAGIASFIFPASYAEYAGNANKIRKIMESKKKDEKEVALH